MKNLLIPAAKQRFRKPFSLRYSNLFRLTQVHPSPVLRLPLRHDAEFSAEWMVNKEEQPVYLSGAVQHSLYRRPIPVVL